MAGDRDEEASSTTNGELERPQSGIFVPVSEAALRDHTTAPVAALSAFTIPVAPSVYVRPLLRVGVSARAGAAIRLVEACGVAVHPHRLAVARW